MNTFDGALDRLRQARASWKEQLSASLDPGPTRAYARAALERELTGLRREQPGGRAKAAFRASAALGSLVSSGLLDGEAIEPLLTAAAVSSGLPEREAVAHVRRGLRIGALSPRVIPGSVAAPSLPPREAPKRPPATLVGALWEGSVTVTAEPEAEAWLRSRGLDPDAVGLWDLARSAPTACDLPRWAGTRGGGPWTRSGHRLLLRMWDARGKPVSLRARSILPEPQQPKELAPAGFAVRGLVLADPLAVQLLAGPPPEWWDRRDVVITEGCPDFLVWASRQREGNEAGPAVFGVLSGSWTGEVASRIPSGARVVIRTHHDAAGEQYARTIADSLRSRCRVFRSPAGGEA